MRAFVLQGLQFVVDNTFSPMVLSPARWGADIVVHSLTKFISGASDIVAGAHWPALVCQVSIFVLPSGYLHG